MIKDLINRLRHLHYLDSLMNEAADALERLTTTTVELPEPNVEIISGHREPFTFYDADQLREYGDRRAAAEREPLTDEEIIAIGKELGLKCRLGGNQNIDFDYARAIEAAHGIRAGGGV